MHEGKITLILLVLYFSALGSGKLIDRSSRQLLKIPVAEKNTADFVETYGYTAEEHEFETRDGWFITIFRIPYSRNNVRKSSHGCVPLVMQHGIILNSDQWVLKGPNDLPFLLSEKGFDVWMTNTRGTKYSRHKKYSKDDVEFWDYSPDDIAAYDLPAIIDYVLETTGERKLSYVGHSRGTMMAVMLLSTQREYNEKIYLLQLLAPVIYTTYAQSPLYFAGNRKGQMMTIPQFKVLAELTAIPRLYDRPKFINFDLGLLCLSGFFRKFVCPVSSLYLSGEDYKYLNYSLLPVIVDHFTDGVSTKEVIHLQQISASSNFQKFDYELEGNLNYYNSKEPPRYNLTLVDVPVFNYFGTHDLFLDEKDHLRFVAELRHCRGTLILPMFNHLDYFWSNSANKALFPALINDTETFFKEIKKNIS